MGELIKPGGRLEVSVSFGRFENDALAWEKWSSFSPNKYLEEVGSLSTPGSVAQKKAYFEAHYEKVAAAAKKAEELELENSRDSVTSIPDGSCSENSSGIVNTTISLSDGERFVEENADAADMNVATNRTINDEVEDDNARSAQRDEWIESTSSNGDAATFNADKAKDELKYSAVDFKPDGRDDSTSEIYTTIANTEEAEDELKYNAVDSKPDDRDDLTVSEIDTAIANVEEAKDELKYNAVDRKPDGRDDSNVSEIDNAIANAEEAKDELKYNAIDSKPDGRDDSEMAGVEILRDDPSLIAEKALKQNNSVENSRVCMKENSKLKKTPQKVTPTKKERNFAETSRKSIASPTLKSSKASTPRNSKPASISIPKTMSRKNEVFNNGTNGDKEIVRRAFKSFQNHFTELSSNERLSSVKQVQSTALKPKVSTSPVPRKGSEGVSKDVKELNTQRIQPGSRSNITPSRSNRSPALKNTVAVSPSTGLRSDERAEKRKEFLKNLEAKSIARETENARRSAKSKEEKECEIKTLRESLNFKAKPIPSFYRN